ncbi:MAG: DUF2892 domain-containing protein [Proteobacteria bacterium]|nr:DUF2892 domain-containing protein [Pseudomonadota bacterium]
MQCNVGKTERRIRMVIGAGIIGAGVYYQNWWGAVGLVPLLTGIFGYCPPYQLLKINTDK